MTTLETSRIVAEALRLRGMAPKAPALDILDLAMTGQTAAALPLEDLARPHAPGSAFGQLLAAALDQSMTPAEWRAYTSDNADPELRAAVVEAWRQTVITRLMQRYAHARLDRMRASPAPQVVAQQQPRMFI